MAAAISTKPTMAVHVLVSAVGPHVLRGWTPELLSLAAYGSMSYTLLDTNLVPDLQEVRAAVDTIWR
jgi:hypothetical protein